MARGDIRGQQASPYRQVQFALDDELVDVGEAAAATVPAAPDFGGVRLTEAIEDARRGAPFTVERTMAAGAVVEHEAGTSVVLTRSSTIETRRDAPTAPETDDEREAPAKTDRVGVVFVHGVGSQPQSETVREFGQPLIEWLEQWHHSRDVKGFRVLWSRLSYGASQQGPAAYALRIPKHGQHEAQTWFLAEAWWASRLAAPSVGTVLGWALGSYPGLIAALWENAKRVLRGEHYDEARPRMSELGRAIASVNALFVLASYALVFLPGQLLLALLTVVASVPLPGFQQFVLLRILQPLLVNNLGDFVVYMHDDVQAMHIRQSVYDAVSWLVREKKCARVVVVAHSQGTVVAFDALSTSSPGGGQSQGPSLERDLRKVTKLITFGAALNRMWDEVTNAKKAGRILRPFAEDLRRGERWTNFFSEFDWAPVGPVPAGKSAINEPVTNNLSALTDHGEYFQNHEQFTSRLAQEIDSPDGPADSRFWPVGGGDRIGADKLHRERRVTTWTLWRSAAWTAVALIFIFRYGGAGHDIASDAEALLRTMASIPLVGAIPGLLTAIGGWIAGVAGILPQTDAVADVIRLVAIPLALTGGAVGAVVAGAYLVLSALLFKGWHRRASISTAHERPQEWSWWSAGWRTAAYGLVLAGVSYWVTGLPSFETIGEILTAVVQ